MRMKLFVVLVLVWAGAAGALSTEPELLIDSTNSLISSAWETPIPTGQGGVSYLSFGDAGGNRVLTYTDVVTQEVMIVDLQNPTPQVFQFPGGTSLHLFACLWGEGIVFCHTETDEFGSWEDAILVFDYNTQVSGFHLLGQRKLMRDPDGNSIGLKSAHGNHLVIEEHNYTISLLTWDGSMLDEVLLPAQRRMPHSPVVGPSGGEFPGAPIYVVFQDQNQNGFILKAWDVDQRKVVSEREVSWAEPRPSDLHGYTFIEGNTPRTIRLWDPTEPPENPDGPPNPPKQVVDTPLNPMYHHCDSLHEARVGPYFGLVRGSNCNAGDDLLFLVARDRNHFVYDYSTSVYQPFSVRAAHRLENAHPFEYAVHEEFFAYYDESADEIVLVEVNLDRIMPIDARTSPSDNNAHAPVPLAPWNVGSWGEGVIDFASGGLFHDWEVFLSENQAYRIFVYSLDHYLCGGGGWPWHTRMTIERGSYSWVVDSNNFQIPGMPATCPGIAIDPSAHGGTGVYRIRIDRPHPGLPGVAPPMSYQLHVEVQ